jgi:hypothetical protein
MKTLSGRFRFVVFGVIVVVAIAGCINFPPVENIISAWCMKIENRQKGTGPYVQWKDQRQFDNALAQICARPGGCYHLEVVLEEGKKPIDPYKPCPPPGCITTVKVAKSKAADAIAAGKAPGTAHVTYHVTSPDPRDLIKVLDALKN